jgi:soluble lytic murein transglycosylase-like protein
MLNRHRNGFKFETLARAIPAGRLARAGVPLIATLAFVVGSSALHYAPALAGAVETVAIGAAEPAGDALSGASPVLAAKAGSHKRHSASLTAEQENVARFIARRYRVAMDQTQLFVAHAYQVAREAKLDPLLVLAVISVESSFNPKAQSNKGAQGLMQVLTRVHKEKFAPFGGVSAAFDPLANMRVGTQILKEYVKRTGSVENGLKYYVGAALLPHDGGYGAKVLFERERIAAAATGRAQPSRSPQLMARAEPARMIEASAAGTSARVGDAVAPQGEAESASARTADVTFRPWVDVSTPASGDERPAQAPDPVGALDGGAVRDI